jgi:hypothetical protein
VPADGKDRSDLHAREALLDVVPVTGMGVHPFPSADGPSREGRQSGSILRFGIGPWSGCVWVGAEWCAHLTGELGLDPTEALEDAYQAVLTGTAPSGTARPRVVPAQLPADVSEYAPRRYGLHDLLAVYAAELSHTAEAGHASRAATVRLLDHYTHSAHAAPSRGRQRTVSRRRGQPRPRVPE